MDSFLSQILVNKLSDELFKVLKSFIISVGRNLISTPNDFSEALNQHLIQIYKWAGSIKFERIKKTQMDQRNIC